MTEPAPYRQFQEFIGIDPGPIPGIVHLWPHGASRLRIGVVQSTADVAPAVLWGLLDSNRHLLGKATTLVQIEQFVVGSRSARSSTASAGEVTRRLIGQLASTAEGQPNVAVVLRSASQVKPWATDERLDACGLLQATKGMRHARDAARHALFAAVRSGALQDPLIKEKK